jgi:dinuclear metal center YbgI/SA1388 family protein
VITVRDVSLWLDHFAPRHLAEAWDNVGLLWGDAEAEVSRVMTCLTVTGQSALEAIVEHADLIVSHHPVLFRATKRVVANQPENGTLWSLAKAGVSILSPHTAFDNTCGGINDGLARRLELVDVGPLRPTVASPEFKVVVFVPRADRDAVLSAAFRAGAGRIGAYEECSFSIPGVGSFFGTESTKPAVGQAGRRESVRELRIEFVCPWDRLADVLAAVQDVHSYEQPAIDVFPLHLQPGAPGAGRLGRLPAMMTLETFARHVARALDARAVRYVGDPGRGVSRVAIACGAGDDFLDNAVSAGADVLFTGEARFHRALEAEALDIGLVLAGHHATERPGVEDLAVRIAAAFPDITVWASAREHDPLQSIEPSAPRPREGQP